MDYSFVPWIIIAGLVFALIMGGISIVTEHQRKLAKIKAEAGAGDERVLAKLDAIEQRLARIEKTLDDVPA